MLYLYFEQDHLNYKYMAPEGYYLPEGIIIRKKRAPYYQNKVL